MPQPLQLPVTQLLNVHLINYLMLHSPVRLRDDANLSRRKRSHASPFVLSPSLFRVSCDPRSTHTDENDVRLPRFGTHLSAGVVVLSLLLAAL